MKKNWKETLKLWLGALLIPFAVVAEAVSTGCKKLRTLPKKVMALCVAAALVVAMVPAYVFAAGIHTNHCVCGEQESVHSNCKDVEWTAWNGTDPIPYDSNKTAYVYLSANAERSSTLTVTSGYTLYLCLSGNTLSPASGFTGRAITVSSGATFVLTDCGTDGAISGFTSATSGGGGVYNRGTFTMYEGTISGNRTTGSRVEGDGGGVYNYDGTVTMYGGTISGNTASRYGGGVCNYGTLTMENVTISGNTAATSGGGVYIYNGTLTMENVTVSDNTANNSEDTYEANGGGICCYAGTLTIRGGTISGNEIKGTSSYGGGITVGSGATAEITDVTISGNISDYSGGGITVGNGTTVKITDVTISGNTAYNSGGGVCNYGTFTMENSTVSGNTSAYNGGGVYNYGTFTIKNSTVSGNTSAYNGGGVYNSVTLNLSGNTKIIDNTKGTAGNLTPNNIYLLRDKTVTVAGALTCEDASIGVTMQNYNGGTFTTGGAAYIGKFVSDSSRYAIAVDSDNLALKFQYTVTFDYGTLGKETKTVLHGETVTPPAPVFAGKVLVGWYKDKWFNTEFNFSDAITNTTTTIYAKFADYEGDKEALQDAIDALEEDVTELNKLTENGGTIAQINAKIASIASKVAELDSLKNKYAEADTALKQELQQELQAADTVINNAITALTGRVETLESELAAATSDISTNASEIAELTADLAALNTSLINLSNKLTNDYATKAELTNAINSATDTINSTIDALTVRVQNLEAGLADADSKIDTNTSKVVQLTADLATLNTSLINLSNKLTNDYATKAELTNAINSAKATINSTIDALTIRVQNLEAGLADANSKINTNTSDVGTLKSDIADLKTWKTEAQDAINALKTLTGTQGTDIANLKLAVQSLEAELAAANARIDDAEDRIAALEGKVSALEIAKQNLDAAVAALNAAINNKADTATLNQKVTDLIAAIAASEAAAKTYADGKDTALQTQLTAAIATAKGEAITAAENLVNTAKAELQTVIDNKADTAAVNAAIANLQNAITALENAKDNYIAADATLKAELEEKIAKAKQEAIDAAKGHIPYIGINGNWWIGDTDTGVDANGIKGEKGDKGDTGADGVGIAKIEKTATNGNVDTYTITLTNGKTYTFTVTNGKDGANGMDGENGKDGADGKDGLTPFIGENGNWWIGETDTGVKAAADDSIPVGSGNVTEAEGVNIVTVVAIVIAGVALLGNVILAVLVLKKKKSLV